MRRQRQRSRQTNSSQHPPPTATMRRRIQYLSRTTSRHMGLLHLGRRPCVFGLENNPNLVLWRVHWQNAFKRLPAVKRKNTSQSRRSDTKTCIWWFVRTTKGSAIRDACGRLVFNRYCTRLAELLRKRRKRTLYTKAT